MNMPERQPLLEGHSKTKTRYTSSDEDSSSNVSYKKSIGFHDNVMVSTVSRLAIDHSTSDMQSLMNFLKGSFGTGILGLPYAIKLAGLLPGAIALTLLGVITASCMHILAVVSHDLCERFNFTSLDFGEVAALSLKHGPVAWLQRRSSIGSYTVNFLIAIGQAGSCCVYFLFMADNIRQIYVFYYGSAVPSTQLFLLMLLLPVLLLCYIRHLDDLTPFSTIANILTAISLVIIYEYLFANLGVFTKSQDIHLLGTIQGFFVFFGTTLYSYGNITLVLPIENKMRNPHHFTRVLVVGTLIVIVMYVIMGILGYLCFGTNTLETITLSLPDTGWYIVVRVMVVFAVFGSFALQFYVEFEVLWPYFMARTSLQYHFMGELILKTVCIVLMMGVAMVIPQLALLLSLVGCFSVTSLGIIIPPLVQELAFFERGYSGLAPKLRLARNIFYFIFGTVGYVIGTYVSLEKIIIALGEPN